MTLWIQVFWVLTSLSQLEGSHEILEVLERLSCRVKHSRTIGLTSGKCAFCMAKYDVMIAWTLELNTYIITRMYHKYIET